MSHQAGLDKQLSAVRTRWIVRDAMLSSSQAILAAVPVCLVLGWLDYHLDFSPPVRVVELAGLIAWAVWVLRRFVVPALTRRRDAYRTALKVESSCDQFGGRLVSRVQFRGGCGVRALGSPGLSWDLIEAMCQRVERDAATMPLTRAISMKPVRRPAIAAALALLVACLLVLAQPALARLWIKRTLLPLSEAPWPGRTQITGIEDGYRVRRGDYLQVTGRAAGDIPRTGALKWHTLPGGAGGAHIHSRGRLVFDICPDGRFAATVGPLLEFIALAIEAGDARREGINVEVVIPPELASIEAVYNYPEFTQRQPERVRSGDVRALVGTRVQLNLEADRPVQRMELVFSGHDGERAEPVRLRSPTEGRTSFVVRARARYQVRLFDAYGFSTDPPATFMIDPIDNRLPTVTLKRPGTEHTVTPKTRVRMLFEAVDDFGVTAAAIRWRTRGAAGSPDDQTPVLTQSIPVSPPCAGWDGQYVWDLARANVQPGDEIMYHLQAHDAGEHLTEEKAGVSATHVLKVVHPDALRQSLEARLRDSLGELDDLRQQQSAGPAGVSIPALSPPTHDEPLSPAELGPLHPQRDEQTRIHRRVEQLAGRLCEVADELHDSFPADSDRVEQLRALAEGLGQAGAGPAKQAVERVQPARIAATAGEGRPWYWNLPPRARDAISQSLAESLPPEYESAIKRYYERLSAKQKDER